MGSPEYHKAYYQQNKERLLAKQNQYYQEHRNERLAYGKTEKAKITNKQWKRNNPEQVAELSKRCKRNPKAIKRAQAKWASSEHDKLVKRVVEGRRRASIGERIDTSELVNNYNGYCGICKQFLDIKSETYHIDHIYPIALGGKHVMSNLQITHPTCNIKKGKRV